MYHVNLTIRQFPLPAVMDKYQDREKFLALCRDCRNYNTRWSCPPLSLDVDAFLAAFRFITLVGAQIVYDDDAIRAADTPDKIQAVAARSVTVVKDRLLAGLIELESRLPGSVSLSSGGCSVCDRCRRLDQEPCLYPEKMRYSLDAFGFDLTAIASELLRIKLKWAKDSLPPYYTLIHALLTAKRTPPGLFAGLTPDGGAKSP